MVSCLTLFESLTMNGDTSSEVEALRSYVWGGNLIGVGLRHNRFSLFLSNNL